jgi:hypothetical protein
VKKRHCDGGNPCYQCQNRGIDCGYVRPMKRPIQNTTQSSVQVSYNNNNTNNKRKITALEEISTEDWQIFKTGIEQFKILQMQLFQDYIHWDIFIEEILALKNGTRVLLELVQQEKLDITPFDINHICTGFIYSSTISIGLEKINHGSYQYWGQKAFDLITSLIQSGRIERTQENQKLLIMDLLIKDAYTRIKRGEFWKAKLLYWHAKMIAQMTDLSKIRDHDKEGSLQQDLPAFIKLHLATFDVWSTKSNTEKITILKSFLNESPDRVEIGTLVLTGLLLCAESEEVFSSLMKATFVPIEPQYRNAVYAYLSKISRNINQATPDQQLIFYLSVALLKIRDSGSPIYLELESAWDNLCQVKNNDSNTCWLCGIGVSLSLLCGSQLLNKFREQQKLINSNFSVEWNKKYELDDKILSATFLSLESLEEDAGFYVG